MALRGRRDALKLCLILVAVLAMTRAATAHAWYSRACCGEMDCAPVERAEHLSDGALRVTTRVGTTVVPASFPRQESPDDRMHVCMVRYSHLDEMRPRVLLRAPAGTPVLSCCRP